MEVYQWKYIKKNNGKTKVQTGCKGHKTEQTCYQKEIADEAKHIQRSFGSTSTSEQREHQV